MPREQSLDLLQSFVPRWVVRRLAQRGAPPRMATATAGSGAALFADISGFTALTERLARQGPDGAERLTDLLDRAFGGMIEACVLTGGDVLSFAGDALLVVWTGDDAVDRALDAAARCHAALTASSTQGEELRLRVGVGGGELSLHELGAGNRWVAVGAGAALHGMALAERTAQPGQTVIRIAPGHPVPAGLDGADGPEGLLVDVRAGDLPPTAAEPSVDWSISAEVGLRAFLPAAVLTRVDAGQTAWMAELRTVSPLFVLLRGLDPSRPSDAPVVQRILESTLDALDVFEGTLDKVLVDDRGTSFVVAFGYPPQAHGDDAVRAVRTALQVEEACRREGQRYGIGVATGRVFCGPYGSLARREYTMLGDSVNLAARLMAASDDAIWCDTATAGKAFDRVRFEEAPAVRVKGKEQAVAVHRPIGELDLTGRHEVLLTGRHEALHTGTHEAARSGATGALASLTLDEFTLGIDTVAGVLGGARMVGRHDERDRLEARLERLAEGGLGGAALIEGAAGMGKSLLGAWLHEEALNRGIAPLLGAADATSRSEPYRAWRDVFVQLLELARFSDRAQARAEVASSLAGPEGFDAWAPLLEPLLQLGFEPNEITATMPGAAAADALRRMLLHLLKRGVEATPRLVLLDDAQWMGPSSWELAATAVDRIPGLLLVVLSRPFGGEPPPEWGALRDSEHGELSRLPGLEDEELQDLVRRRLGADEVPAAVMQAVVGRADGNPYFAEELVWALLDSGQLTVEGGICTIPDERALRSLDLPDTLQGVVTARLDRLDPRDALTAKIAAVLGREFGWDELRAVHPVDASDAHLREQLDRLCRDTILSPEEGPGAEAWSFRSLVLQESAYGLLPFTRRRALHRAVAEWYESGTADLGPLYPLLAHHWRRAEDFDRALTCLENAELRLSRLGAQREGLELLRTAFEVAEAAEGRGEVIDPDRKHDWTGRIGTCHHGLGDFLQAQVALHEAVINLGVSIPRGTAGWVLKTLWQVVIQARNVLLPTLRPRYRDDADRERLLKAAVHTSRYGNTCYFTVEPLKWFTLSLMGVNLAERACDDRPASEGLSSLGNIAGTLKLQGLADAYFRRARTTEDATNLAVADWAEGVVHLTFCRWERFHSVVNAGLARTVRVGDRATEQVGLAIQGIGLWLHGEPHAAVTATADCLSSARATGNVEHVSWGLTFSAPALLAVGESARLRAQLREAAGALEGFDPFTRIVYEGVLAQCRVRDGDLDGGVLAAAELVRRFGEHSLTMYTYLPAFGGAAEALLEALHAQRQGRAVAVPEGTTLPRLCRRVLKGLKTHGGTFHYFQPRAAMARGTLAWIDGEPKAARKHWARAAERAQALELPYEAALVELERARWLPGAEGAAAADVARTMLLEIGASGDLARLDASSGAGEDAVSASA